MSAITSILRILRKDIDVLITKSQKEATFDSYLMEILSIQSFPNGSRGPNPSTTEQLQRSIDSNDPSIKKNSKNP
jgi:hypothetical protein